MTIDETASGATAYTAGAALALTSVALGAVASRRPTISATSTPEEIAEFYAWRAEMTAAEQEADPDNRFLNAGDTDWNTGTDGFIKTGSPAGLNYTVADDGRITLHNNSIEDIAITGLYYPTWSSQGTSVIHPGESYTVRATPSSTT